MKQLLFSFFLSVPFALLAQSKAEAYVKEGVALHDRGYYEEALLKYDSALLMDNRNYLANYEKAYTLTQLKRFKEVVPICKFILANHKNEKNLSEVYSTYGTALDMMGKKKESLAVYEEGITSFPDAYLLYFNKAITLFSLGENEKAIGAAKHALVANPNHASSHHVLATAYLTANKVLALMAAVTFLTLEPEGERAKVNLKRVQNFLTAEAKMTGDNSYTVNLDAGLLLKKENNKADNFSITEMIMTLSTALNVDEKHKNESLPDRFERNLQTVISSLKETAKDGRGFGWDYYVPFFIALDTGRQLNTLAHLVFASADDAGNTNWIKENNEKIKNFYDWYRSFAWPRPQL